MSISDYSITKVTEMTEKLATCLGLQITVETRLQDVREELGELTEALRDNNNIDLEYGDLLFTVLALGKRIDRHPASCLQKTLSKLNYRLYKIAGLPVDKAVIEYNNVKELQRKEHL